MLLTMPKETRLNLRITGQFRREIETLAAYHGLSLSGVAHSLLVKAVRREFQELESKGEAPRKTSVTAVRKPVTISSDAAEEALEKKRLREQFAAEPPKKRKTG